MYEDENEKTKSNFRKYLEKNRISTSENLEDTGCISKIWNEKLDEENRRIFRDHSQSPSKQLNGKIKTEIIRFNPPNNSNKPKSAGFNKTEENFELENKYRSSNSNTTIVRFEPKKVKDNKLVPSKEDNETSVQAKFDNTDLKSCEILDNKNLQSDEIDFSFSSHIEDLNGTIDAMNKSADKVELNCFDGNPRSEDKALVEELSEKRNAKAVDISMNKKTENDDNRRKKILNSIFKSKMMEPNINEPKISNKIKRRKAALASKYSHVVPFNYVNKSTRVKFQEKLEGFEDHDALSNSEIVEILEPKITSAKDGYVCVSKPDEFIDYNKESTSYTADLNKLKVSWEPNFIDYEDLQEFTIKAFKDKLIYNSISTEDFERVKDIKILKKDSQKLMKQCRDKFARFRKDFIMKSILESDTFLNYEDAYFIYKDMMKFIDDKDNLIIFKLYQLLRGAIK